MLDASGWRAVGLDSLRFAEALARASEPAYILALPRRPASEAFARATLLAAAPWLARLDRPGGRIIALVDTREALIARRARALPPISVDWDGTLVFGARQHAAVEGAP